MKNIFYKIGLVLTTAIMLTHYVKAQLPLLQGDAVITHSSYGSVVVRIVHLNNTSTAPLGTNWNTPSMNPVGTKPHNDNYSNWTQSNLGNVFGITLDQNPAPNIYVSSTQIYNAGTTYDRKIWRLNGTSGTHTLVYDFPPTSVSNIKSLGNLKYAKIGTTENIYVSNWDNGKIERITGISTVASIWAIQTGFIPKFGKPQHDAHEMAYGLAIRNMSGGGHRLYYAKISTNSDGANTGTGASIGGFGNNEIWSISLNPANGDFNGPEIQENIPNMNRPPVIDGNTGTLVVLPVIADIAFTEDGKQMLVGQQSWGTFGSIAPHNSNVWEFKDNSGVWLSSGDIFKAGENNGTNAVGGVSYSNNIIQGNSNALACDTTVWFTADAIVYQHGSLLNIYGLQGMNANNGGLSIPNPYPFVYSSDPNSIWIDEDDDLSLMDKRHLGDVEVYKKPLNCAPPCACGSWLSTPTLNGVLIPGVPITKHPFDDIQKNKTPLTLINPGPIVPVPVIENYPIQFVQGTVLGTINAIYECTGNCGTKYTWNITNDATSAVVTSGTTLPVDLALYNSLLQCGNYTLHIRAGCGNTKCGGLTIPISIICEPPSCCKASIDIDLYHNSVNAITNTANPNAVSSADFTYNINFSLPMSEVRVSVEEFKLVTNSPNCLNCNNRPATWGNILSASLNGIAMTLSGMTSVPTGSLAADYREAVYNTGTPLPAPGVGLSLRLSLPAITELSCCEVSAYICLKFTFKDTQCRECVQMACANIKLIAPAVINTGGKKIDKIEIKKFNVIH